MGEGGHEAIECCRVGGVLPMVIAGVSSKMIARRRTPLNRGLPTRNLRNPSVHPLCGAKVRVAGDLSK